MIGFVYVLILLTSATYLGHLSEKLGQPRIVGQIAGGIIVGPITLILIRPYLGVPILSFFSRDRVNDEIQILIDFGRIFLMLGAGIETDLSRLFETGKNAFASAIGGMILPLSLGYGAGILLGLDLLGRLFLAVSLSITAVALSVSVLIEMGKLNTDTGSTIIGAAVIDDVLGIFLLSILLSMIEIGKIPSTTVLIKEILIAITFVILSLYIAPKIIQKFRYKITRLPKNESLGIIICIVTGFSLGAELSGLHAMIGSYIAGLVIGPIIGEQEEEELRTWIWGFFAPIFFAWIGFSMSISRAAFGVPLLLITLIAFVGKIFGSGIGALLSGLKPNNALLVGIGMNARGAIELIVAEIAIEAGIISNEIFSSIILMAIITSITTPIAMKKGIKHYSL